MASIWEKENFYHYDYLIIGAGITGLSTALALRIITGEKSKISVIDREILPSGASTRNAGFACFGSFTEILSDMDLYGKDKAFQLVEDRYKGIQYLIQHYGEQKIGLERNGGYELIFEDNYHKLSHFDSLNKDLSGLFNNGVFQIKNEKIKPFGFQQVKELIFTPFEFQLNPGMLMQALYDECLKNNIRILTGGEVFDLEDNGSEVVLYLNNDCRVCAKKVAICTNAFTPALIPDLNITPGRGMILLTEPVADLPFKGSFHFDRGYYYFREYQNRILFGGGRNTDFKTETTDEIGINPGILQNLKQKLHEIIIPGKSFQVDSCWSGIMAFGKSKSPIVKKVSENIAVGARLGGMGVALASQIGQKVACLLTD